MARKMIKRRYKYCPFAGEAGIVVFFWNNHERSGERLGWLEKNKYVSQGYKVTGDVTAEVIDAMINEIYYVNVKEPSKGNMEEDLDKCIAIMRTGRAILAGGLVFLQNDIALGVDYQSTGCCCGMEMWKKIIGSLKDDGSPWMGHDPWINLKVQGDNRIICDDKFERIKYSKEEFYNYLDIAEAEATKFIEGPMTERLRSLCPDKAEEFMDAFRISFDYK